jgi:PKD repeat protein
MPDGSIVLTGGFDGFPRNDTWRFQPAGSTEQSPSHTYTSPGIYNVSLQVFDTAGYTSTRKAGYITVNASPVIAPVIGKAATIYIGERGLNVTHALNLARGTTTPAANNSVPTLTQIGWWASAADMYVTAPSKTIDLGVADRYKSLTVAPADFVGFTGSWYLLSAGGATPYSTDSLVFSVQDPRLDISIRDFDLDSDVTDRSTMRGDSLGFGIDTNMQGALNSRYRYPVHNSQEDGYINIKVRNESGFTFTELSDSLNNPLDLLRQNVSTSPWTWGAAGNPTSPTPWATGVADGEGRLVYPVGTYTVWAESRLNHMKETYTVGGADYVGKTISPSHTVTLVNESLQIEANKDSVLRGQRFSVTIVGKPGSACYLWVNNTGTMTGAPEDQPPTIMVSAPVYQDPYGGPFLIGAHPILGAGGKIILQDVPKSTTNVSRNEYYAKVMTSSSGVATVEIRTSPQTKPGTYRLRVENPRLADDVAVVVVPEILPGPVNPVTAGKVINHPVLNPDVPTPVNNDLKRILQGGTIFIGEDGLNITGALASANAAAVPVPSPNATVIGWWASAADLYVSSPSKIIDLAGRENNLEVSPADFVGYTGTWYLINPANGHPLADSQGSPVALFSVQDPSLDMKIWDLDTGADVTGRSVPQGERLTFRVDTNMYAAFDSRYRPDITAGTPGTIEIKVKNERGARLNYLYRNNTAVISLLGLRVDQQPWFWGGGVANPSGGGYWGTDLLDRDHYYFYPAGTYTVCAESTLNNMKANYKQGGADYTGKTVSQCYTITLVTDQVQIEAYKTAVTRGQFFTVTVTGRPKGLYYLWLEDTSDLNGGPGNQPPMISLFQEGVLLDPPAGPAVIGSYQYENGGGKSIKMNVGTDPVYNGTRFYARITTSLSGLRTVEFATGSLTRNRTYTLRVENLSGGRFLNDEVMVTVERGTPAAGIGIFRPSTRQFFLKNGTSNRVISFGLSTDIPVTGDWNGDGVSEVGVFRNTTQKFYLKNGTSTTVVAFGLNTDLPVTGDWNGDGLADAGVFRPAIHKFILKNGTEKTLVAWGVSSDIPVAGDWNRDGLADVGVFRPSTHRFLLKNGSSTTTVNWGLSTDIPVTGDWNGDGLTDVGVFRGLTPQFILKNGSATTVIRYGLGTDLPVTGRWS